MSVFIWKGLMRTGQVGHAALWKLPSVVVVTMCAGKLAAVKAFTVCCLLTIPFASGTSPPFLTSMPMIGQVMSPKSGSGGGGFGEGGGGFGEGGGGFGEGGGG